MTILALSMRASEYLMEQMRKGDVYGMKKLLPLFLAVSAMVVAAQIAKTVQSSGAAHTI